MLPTTWLEINAKALLHNIKQIKKQLSRKTKFMAVVKANAYGHGLIEVVEQIKNNVDYLAVYDFEDALRLRKKKIFNAILVLGRVFENQIDLAIKNKIEITVSTFDLLKACCKKQSQQLIIHLCVDTGLGREGFLMEQKEKVRELLKKSLCEIKGLYSHFAAADDSDFNSYSEKQISELLSWKKLLWSLKIKPLLHNCATAGSLNKKFSKNFDLARIGIGLYGLYPSKQIKNQQNRNLKLSPVLSWRAKIIEIKSLAKGSFISYGCSYVLKRDSKIALLAIGYYDGIFRSSSNKSFLLLNGLKVPKIGRVMMNVILIDVTKVVDAKVGDVATIIGCDGKNEVSVDDWAMFSKTINYEITTRINSVIKRKIIF
jgi:alanine racemase